MFPLKSGTRCKFRLADVICPDRQQILSQITPDLEVGGEIVLLSDGGTEPQQYAIVEVPGIAAPLIVPVSRIQQNGEPIEKRTSDAAVPREPDEARYEKVGLKS